MSRILRWAWIAIIVVALALRGGALNLAPLVPEEAEIALNAWIATQGQGWPQASESPLLLLGNALLFTLFGAGDGVGVSVIGTKVGTNVGVGGGSVWMTCSSSWTSAGVGEAGVQATISPIAAKKVMTRRALMVSHIIRIQFSSV